MEIINKPGFFGSKCNCGKEVLFPLSKNLDDKFEKLAFSIYEAILNDEDFCCNDCREKISNQEFERKVTRITNEIISDLKPFLNSII
jgi:hypothetical protein